MCKAHNPSERWHGDTMPSAYRMWWGTGQSTLQDQTCHQIIINVYVLLVRSSLFKILQWYLIWLFRSVLKQIKTSYHFFSLKTTSQLDGLVFCLDVPPLSSLCMCSDISLTCNGLLILCLPRCYVSLHPYFKASSVVTHHKNVLAVSSFPLTACLYSLLTSYCIYNYIILQYLGEWKGPNNIQNI